MPFVKGQSGNPKGRPKEDNSITSMLRKYGGEKVVHREGQELTREQAIALDMWSEALDGNQRVREYIVDRLEGKPTQVNETINYEPPKVITVGKHQSDSEDMESVE